MSFIVPVRRADPTYVQRVQPVYVERTEPVYVSGRQYAPTLGSLTTPVVVSESPTYRPYATGNTVLGAGAGLLLGGIPGAFIGAVAGNVASRQYPTSPVVVRPTQQVRLF